MEELASILAAAEHVARTGKLTPNQWDAFRWLQQNATEQQRRAFSERWRAAPAPAPSPGAIRLPVPYFSQRDSATSQGDRMCFSSTCTMAVAFLKPKALQGEGQPDDLYLARLRRYGDTTDAPAHVALLNALGIPAQFRRDASPDLLLGELQAGRPVAVGWLHKGPVSAPAGGGHWSLVIGWDQTRQRVIMHDPFGEADLVSGGYLRPNSSDNGHRAGAAQSYSLANWGRRWMVEGAGSGWVIRFS